MILLLQALPPTIRGPNDPAYNGKFPARARMLAPDAASSIRKIESEWGNLIYTDMWRSAESSLLARRTKRGVQSPGYSAHNFGLAIDLDVDAIMKEHNISYKDLCIHMESYGWFSYRRDYSGPNQSEAWHFNYLGANSLKHLSDVDVYKSSTWSSAAERAILERYGSKFSMSNEEVQQELTKLRLYHGTIDGIIGARSREAIMAFQRAWDLTVDGQAGIRTQRTLAFVSSEIKVIPAA